MKTRNWCGTNFDLDFDWQALVDSGYCTYIAYGNETCPTTGKAHHQFFCRFKHPKASIKRTKTDMGLDNGWIKPCNGTLKQNEDYCSKEGTLIELGEKPKQGFRSDLEGTRQMIVDGVSQEELAENNFGRWCQYGRRFEEYRALIEPDRDWKPEVYVWWGTPESGKTRAAVEWLNHDYDVISIHNSFMIGYYNNPNVLIDDMDYKTMPRDMFLQLTHEYKYNVNVKNGEKKWNPRRIAITSNFHPREWFFGDERAVLRRITKIINLDGTDVNGTEVAEG